MASLALFGTHPLPRMAQSMCWNGKVAAYAVGADVYGKAATNDDVRGRRHVARARFFFSGLITFLPLAVVDVGTGQTMAVLKGPVRNDRIDMVLAASSHAFLVCLTRMESALLYNLHDYSLVATLSATKSSDGDGSGFVAACVSSVHPFVFYARHGSKQIYMLDLSAQRATGKFDGKKTVTCLAAHPTKPLFASGHIDGSVRLWDYQLGSCRVTEEYNLFAQSSARLVPSPFGISSVTLSADMVLAASAISLVVAFRVSGKGLTMVAARVLNASRGGSNLGVLTAVEYHSTQEFFMSCFSLGKIQSWRVVHSATEDIHSIVRSADVTPADFMHLLRGAYRSTLPAYILPPVLQEFVIRRIVLHPNKHLVSFGLAEEHGDGASVIDLSSSSEKLHPVFDLTSSCNPKVPRLPAAASVGVPFADSFSGSAEGELFYVKRGQLVSYSLGANENVVLRPIPEVGPTVHAVRVCMSGGAAIVMVEKVEATGASSSTATMSAAMLTSSNKLVTERPNKRVNIVSTAYVLSKSGSSLDGMEARDAVFLGKDHFAVLDSTGLSLSIVHLTNANKQMHKPWEAPVDRIFSAPSSDRLVLFSSATAMLTHTFDGKNVFTPFAVNPNAGGFATRRKETVIQLEWQSFGSVRGPVCFVLTNERLLLLNERLEMLTQLNCEANSALWCSSVVLFSRKESCTIDYLCIDGHTGSLVGTDGDSDTSICGVLRDRVIFVAPAISDSQIKAAFVWPFECVANGILGLGEEVSSKTTEELLMGLTNTLDYATMVSRDLVVRLMARGFVSACRKILAAAPSLCIRLIGDGMWAEEAPPSSPVPSTVLVNRPDHVEGWMVQKLDFFRGAMKSVIEEHAQSTPALSASIVVRMLQSTDEAQPTFLPVPTGFISMSITSARLPTMSTVTFASSLLSTEMTPQRVEHLVEKLKMAGTPVFQMRKPPPRAALPQTPSEIETSTSPSASMTRVVPLELPKSAEQDDEEDVEDNDHTEPSDMTPGGSPLIRNRSSSLAEADDGSFSRMPFVPRLVTDDDSVIVPVTDAIRQSGMRASGLDNADSSFASIIVGMGQAEDDGVLVERAKILSEEAISLFELGLLSEALLQATEAVACFAQSGDSEEKVAKLRQCASYKVLLQLLLRKQKEAEQSEGSARVSLLATLAAHVAGIEMEHRKVLIVDAIRENVRAKNFRVAKTFITSFGKVLGNDASKDTEAVMAMEVVTDAQEWCLEFGDPVLFCCGSFRLLTSADKFFQCEDCQSTVSAVAVANVHDCIVCGKAGVYA